MIFTENGLLHRLANVWSYVTRYIKRKRTNRFISNNQKLDVRNNWIKGATVKAMCNQACPYQQQFSLLCPHSSLSAASRLIKLPRLYHCEWWLTSLKKVLIFKCASSFSFRGQSFKHLLCVMWVPFLCLCVVQCVSQIRGLFWFINAISRQSTGAACTTLTSFFFAAILKEMKRGKKEDEQGGEREEWWWYHG